MQTQHSLRRDNIVANNESATNMSATNMSTGEYTAVPRSTIATYMHAHELQVRAILPQRWRSGPCSPPRPTPTLHTAPRVLSRQTGGVLEYYEDGKRTCEKASLSEMYLCEGGSWG